MTESFDPQKPSRKKPGREPATIDLKAKVVDDAAAEPTDAETVRLVSEAMAETEATADSGLGTDSIASAPGDEATGGPPAGAARDDGPPPRAPDPARRTSPGVLLATGVVGGLVGAGLVYGVQAWRQPVIEDDRRLTQLEQRVAGLGQPANTQGLETRLKALEDARSALERRLQGAEAAAKQAETRAGEALNRPVPEAAAPRDEAALKAIADRIATLEGQVQSQAQAQAQAARQAGGSAESLQQSVQGLESRLAESDRRLAALTQKLGQGPDDVTLAALRLALTERLGDALRRGVPYAGALDALRKVTKDPGRLAALEPFAQKGAPTAADLARSFEPARAAILRDDRASSGNSWTDRLWRMTDRVVTVRPVEGGNTAGVPGLVARIDGALARDDVAAAADAWKSLPEPSRRLSEDWGRQLQARAEAEAAAQAAAADAVSVLPSTQQ